MTVILGHDAPIEKLVAKGGGKAANLARLAGTGAAVPPWFCVSSDAFGEFVRVNALEKHLRVAPGADLSEVALRIEKAFAGAEIPGEIIAAIDRGIAESGLGKAFVAVRSSGLDEDSAEHSFAGQFSSFLFQKGSAAIGDSLKRCWASAYSERALAYRLNRGLPVERISMGVVIQKMVDAESAGVAFSRNPMRPLDRENVIVSSVWGLGEGLVSGELDADHFEVPRTGGETKSRIVPKSHAMRQAPAGGLVHAELVEEQRDRASLSEAQVAEVARLATVLEERLGAPQDCEWAYADGRLYCLQTRPVTTLPPAAFYDPAITGRAPILWDNSNIIESYSGVTSPLTFTFARAAYEQVYLQFCQVMGMSGEVIRGLDSTFRNMLGQIRGRVYYNLLSWYKLVLLLPGSSSNKAFMETMMGTRQSLKPEFAKAFEFMDQLPKTTLAGRVRVLGLTLWRFYRMDSIVSTFQEHFEKVYQDTRKRDFRAMSLTDLSELYWRLYDQLLRRWQAPIINDYLCMIFFGLLKKLSENWLKDPSIQNDLLCGQGDLESTEPTKTLMRIAARVDAPKNEGEKRFREEFLATSARDAWERLSKGGWNDEAADLVRDFLDRYGFRCVNELKLEEPDLHDDPSFAVAAVQSYVRMKSYSVEAMEQREREIRDAAEAKVDAALSGSRKALFNWVLRHARKAVRNRENLRFARTKIFGIVRHVFRAMGSHLAKLGVLERGEDVFYLTTDELFSYIEGRGAGLALGKFAEIRKQEFEIYRKEAAPPSRFMTVGAAGASFRYPMVLADADLLRSEKKGNDDPNVLSGTPCCPGVIEGVVRVVHSMSDAENLNGEILVTERTDPGWVPLYPSCSGLLIERGSLLSHSAVVARELGLPTIVGIPDGLMSRLRTGMRVQVDAGKGEVRILA